MPSVFEKIHEGSLCLHLALAESSFLLSHFYIDGMPKGIVEDVQVRAARRQVHWLDAGFCLCDQSLPALVACWIVVLKDEELFARVARKIGVSLGNGPASIVRR